MSNIPCYGPSQWPACLLIQFSFFEKSLGKIVVFEITTLHRDNIPLRWKTEWKKKTIAAPLISIYTKSSPGKAKTRIIKKSQLDEPPEASRSSILPHQRHSSAVLARLFSRCGRPRTSAPCTFTCANARVSPATRAVRLDIQIGRGARVIQGQRAHAHSGL